MARKSTALIALVLLTGCVSTDQKQLEVSAQQQGQATARIVLKKSDMPDDCTDLVGKVAVGKEPLIVTVRRQEILAANKDDKSRNCGEWWADYIQRVAKASGSN